MNSAFEPFYNETIVVRTKSGKRQSLEVSIFTDIEEEPYSDDMMDTNTRQVQFIARQDDWAFVQKMERGDNLIHNNTKYSVMEVRNDYAIGILIKARQI